MNDLSDKVFGRQRRRLLKEKDRRDDLQLMIYGNRNFLDLSGQALEKKTRLESITSIGCTKFIQPLSKSLIINTYYGEVPYF